MSLKHYTYIWLLILALFSVEYYFVNTDKIAYSFIYYLKNNMSLFKDLNPDLSAGRPISYYLGWVGFLTMCATNFYILRKRFAFLHKVGKLKNWLNFHIFLGLMGPTFILFHTNFKVGGLVALSFWSMMIVAWSGILGRYIYIQTVSKKNVLYKNQVKARDAYIKMAEDNNLYKERVINKVFARADEYAGTTSDESNTFKILFSSIAGDINMLFGPPATIKGMPEASRYLLKRYAVNKRRADTANVFQKLLGYWHSFHLPFAFIMYIAAIIHIVVALLFQVK